MSKRSSSFFGICLAIVLSGLFVEPTKAEVIDSSVQGFTITNKVTVSASSDKVYDAIVKIGNWWSPDHTYSGNSKNLSIEPVPGGCFCEIASKLQVRHGTVVFVNPGKLLRISTALGPLQEQGVSGALTFSIKPVEKVSEIEMTYRAGGYFQGGLDKIAPPVDSVQKEQLHRLKQYLDTGNPNKP
jgi:uncharacterized protein YndB with AHSA1/START domain